MMLESPPEARPPKENDKFGILSHWLQALPVQLVLFSVTAVVAPLLIVGAITRPAIVAEVESDVRANHLRQLNTVTELLDDYLEALQADVIQISLYPPLTGLLRARDNNGVDPLDNSTTQQWENRLQQIFQGYARGNPNVRQVRLIRENGEEWVRVNNDGQQTTSVSRPELQDKSGREYVKDTLLLPEGHTRVSPISLNEDFGRIVEPHEAMLRVSTPVWYEGRPQGVVVINVSPEGIFEDIEIVSGGDLIVAGPDGAYYYHGDPSKLWGNQLGHNANLFTDWPDLPRDGPLDNGLVESEGQLLLWKDLSSLPGDKKNAWHVGVQWSRESFYALSDSLQWIYTGASLVFGVITALLAACIAMFWTRPLLQLTHYATLLQAGNFSARAPRGRGREVQALSQALSAMAESLKNYTGDLEAEVEARTTELEKAKSEAEAASVAKGAFLATMSHELRTPLNAILGFSQLMARDENLTQHQAEQLGIINRCGNHLLRLINQVLDVSKIEAGKLEYQYEAASFHQILKDLEDMMRARAREKGIGFEFEKVEGLPDFIRIDALKTSQILINLVGNAIKFTETGTVSLRAEQHPHRENQLLITVSDSGPGIPADRIEDVFTSFSQIQGEVLAREGSGLGLTIARQFARGMGGDITASSVLGQGATFEFVLPYEAAAPHEVAASNRRQYQLIKPTTRVREKRVLIVEDNPDNARLLSDMLNAFGVQHKLAENGLEGVEMWRMWKPHLILMDIRMPVMNGIDATRKIRMEDASVPILGVTASVSERKADTIESGLFSGFFPKPIEANLLYEKIAELLEIDLEYEAPAEAPQYAGGDDLHTLARKLRSEHPDLVEVFVQKLHELDPLAIEDAAKRLVSAMPQAEPMMRMAREFNYEELLELFDDPGE